MKINIVTKYKFSELGKAFSATLTSHTSGSNNTEYQDIEHVYDLAYGTASIHYFGDYAYFLQLFVY